MRYFNLIPLNGTTAKLLTKLIKPQKIKRGLGVFDVSEKGKDKVFSGKLTPFDIDVIRYLNFVGYRGTKIKKAFPVAETVIYKTLSRDVFRKHVSPFEDIMNGIHPVINHKKARLFYVENQKYIDNIILKISD